MGPGPAEWVQARRRSLEIRRIERALGRYEQVVWDMEDAFKEVGGCCPQCMFGSKWTEANAQIERTAEWLHILKGKWVDSPTFNA